MKMRIAIDAMGGDYAPVETVKGALLAAKEYESDVDIILIGDESVIKKEIDNFKSKAPFIQIVHTTEVIDMSEPPTRALKAKPNSSISVGNRMLKNKEIDGFVSVGNTGAMFASALMTAGRLKGVNRPTIGSYMPTIDKGCTIFDVGANTTVKPVNLLQFAIMGSIYVEHIFGWKDPKVGLLNIGAEPLKGNDLTVETHALLTENLPNFYGNIEGKDILKGKVEVVVCDGFVGNILLKFAESIYDLMKSKVQLYLSDKPIAKVGAAFMAPALKQLKKDLDYQEYGGVPLLGINGIAVIGHGHSSAIAIKNAIRVAKRAIAEKINEIIQNELVRISKIKTEIEGSISE